MGTRWYHLDMKVNNTMDTDTPRTDNALSLHYSEGDYFGEETTKEAYEFARELERELNEMTAKQIELVNHLNLYRGQVNFHALTMNWRTNREEQ